MAAKRLFDESGSDPDNQTDKRPRSTTRPTLASVISEAMMMNSVKNFFYNLEPMLRKVVNEEVENTLKLCSRSFTRSPSLQNQSLEPSTLQLAFAKNLSIPIFTGTKIVDIDGNALQVLLLDTSGSEMVRVSLPNTIKLEVVVVDGDFPSDDCNVWGSEDFSNNLLKERTGRRPLLAGDCLTVTLRDGIAPIGEIEFTDNSSWVRSRKFRIGARVAPGNSQGFRIREAMTEAFVVKDHRGELYKKHHPPMLGDEVWRLEKIGKDGAFHKKLAAASINTVQDLLKLSVVEPQRLRKILGQGMTEKMWDVTIKHARECELGNRHYIFRQPSCTITLNPICQVVGAIIDGHSYSTKDLSNINRSYIENLVRQANAAWNTLEETVVVASESTALLTQGEIVDQCPNNLQISSKQFHQIGFSTDRYMDMANLSNSPINFGGNNWQMIASPYNSAPIHEQGGIHYSISDQSSSDGELTTPRSYITGN